MVAIDVNTGTVTAGLTRIIETFDQYAVTLVTTA